MKLPHNTDECPEIGSGCAGDIGRSEEDRDAIANMEDCRNEPTIKRLAVHCGIVGALASLLSEASRYITCQVLWIDGGGFML